MANGLFEATFRLMQRSFYRNVAGVICVDSGVGGPCMGITVMTHGNEPCGLGVVQAFLDNPGWLRQGRIIFCLNNLEAGEHYYEAANPEARRQARFVDVNMNRLPQDVMTADRLVYEYGRAQDLASIWQEFDYALDIHSTEQDSVPMLIEGPASDPEVVKALPLDVVIRGIVDKQLRYPALKFYQEGCISYGMEAGSHEQPEAGESALQVARTLLGAYGMGEQGVQRRISEQQVYRVEASVVLPQKQYELSRIFELFSPVRKGDILAREIDGHDEVICPIDGVAIFAPTTLRPTVEGEEVMFLCVKVEG